MRQKILIAVLAVLSAASVGMLGYQKINKSEMNQIVVNQPVANRPIIATPDETAGWETYKNEQYDFEIKYPENFAIQEISEDGRYVNFAPFAGTYIQIFAGSDSWKLPLQFRYMSSNNSATIAWGDLEKDVNRGKYSIEQGEIAINGNQWEKIIVKDEYSVVLARYYLEFNGFFVILDQSLISDLTILNQMLSTFKIIK